jgi:hypothetical protein
VWVLTLARELQLGARLRPSATAPSPASAATSSTTRLATPRRAGRASRTTPRTARYHRPRTPLAPPHPPGGRYALWEVGVTLTLTPQLLAASADTRTVAICCSVTSTPYHPSCFAIPQYWQCGTAGFAVRTTVAWPTTTTVARTRSAERSASCPRTTRPHRQCIRRTRTLPLYPRHSLRLGALKNWSRCVVVYVGHGMPPPPHTHTPPISSISHRINILSHQQHINIVSISCCVRVCVNGLLCL